MLQIEAFLWILSLAIVRGQVEPPIVGANCDGVDCGVLRCKEGQQAIQVLDSCCPVCNDINENIDPGSLPVGHNPLREKDPGGHEEDLMGSHDDPTVERTHAGDSVKTTDADTGFISGLNHDGRVFHFAVSEEFPSKGKVTMTSSSHYTIYYGGPFIAEDEGEPCDESINTCDSDEICRVIDGKAKCIVSCRNVVCDVPAEICKLVAANPCMASPCRPVPRCLCTLNASTRCAEPACYPLCSSYEKCVLERNRVCGECPTAVCRSEEE